MNLPDHSDTSTADMLPSSQTSGLGGLGLMTGVPQMDNFCRVAERGPSAKMAPSSTPRPWPIRQSIDAPETFEFDGATLSFEQSFESTETAALLLLQGGAVRYERYALTGGPEVSWISFSVAKSFVSVLVGIAVDEGYIRSIEDPISRYIRVLPGSAYDGVPIRDVLRMSSGARWSEDYSDPKSDARRLGAVMSQAGSLEDFVATMSPDVPPGILCRYNSGDTQALGLMVKNATGRSLAEYMQEKLCEPLGFTSSSGWLVDGVGTEAAFVGLTMTAHDFARVGELYRNGGQVDGKQVVPAWWVAESVRDSAPRPRDEHATESDVNDEMGYGYQWWVPAGGAGEFMAWGAYNQFVFVDPTREVVVVKLSATRTFGTTMDESENRDRESLAFLRGLARNVDLPTQEVP